MEKKGDTMIDRYMRGIRWRRFWVGGTDALRAGSSERWGIGSTLLWASSGKRKL